MIEYKNLNRNRILIA